MGVGSKGLGEFCDVLIKPQICVEPGPRDIVITGLNNTFPLLFFHVISGYPASDLNFL